jgi:hypothetical protein
LLAYNLKGTLEHFAKDVGSYLLLVGLSNYYELKARNTDFLGLFMGMEFPMGLNEEAKLDCCCHSNVLLCALIG